MIKDGFNYLVRLNKEQKYFYHEGKSIPQKGEIAYSSLHNELQ